MANDTIYSEYQRKSVDELERLRTLAEAYDSISTSFVDALPGLNPERVLELGPGIGSMADAFRRRWPKAAITVVDSDERIVSWGSAAGYESISIDLERHTELSGTYDFIYARAVVNLLYRRHELIEHLASCLTGDGLLTIEGFDFLPASGSSHSLLSDVWKALERGSHEVNVEVNWLEHLPALLESHGFTPVAAQHQMVIARAGGPAAQYWAMSLELAEPFLCPTFIEPKVLTQATELLRDSDHWLLLPGLTSVAAVRNVGASE